MVMVLRHNLRLKKTHLLGMPDLARRRGIGEDSSQGSACGGSTVWCQAYSKTLGNIDFGLQRPIRVETPPSKNTEIAA